MTRRRQPTVRTHSRTAGIAALVTDIYMGGGDGFVLISALRDQGRTLPIIAMSGGKVGLDVLGFARKLGADATLAKPFRSRDLIALLERLLAAAEPARPSTEGLQKRA
jgi:two-component system, NarL family, capsular synthesis sensor histidine kinase RcsC